MAKKYYSICLILMLLAFSCTSDLFKTIAANDIVPDKEAVPVVNSFEKANALLISWDKDRGAEEYILYKDVLYNGSFSEIAYQGSDLSYTDNNVPKDDIFYYYKLSKKRGQKEFDKSRFSFGTSSAYSKDTYEPNDTIDNATSIDSMLFGLDANIYYARDGYDNEIIDADWYSITIAAKTMVTYNIIFNSDTDTTGLGYNNVLTVSFNNGQQDLSNNTPFTIKNITNSNSAFYFGLMVKKGVFLGPNSNVFGKRIISYTLKFNRIDPIQ